ncbi:MAG: hypothetical protein ACODAQ_00940 [Phycisphaeraceae bacterium]
MRTMEKRWLIAIVLGAVVLRLAAIVVLQAWDRPNAMEHAALAINLLEGNGFAFNAWDYHGPSSVQSPPYPLLLAGLFWLFGAQSAAAYAVAMVINALVGGAAVALTYLLARELGAAASVGLVAAFLCAIWPTQVYAVAHAQAVALIIAGTVATLALFNRATRTGDLWNWIGFSVAGCLTALTEAAILPIVFFTGLLILLWRSLPMRKRVRNAAVLLVAGLVILGPWTVRNYVVHDKLMPVKSSFWVNVWKGNNPHATGTDRLPLSDEQRRRLEQGSLFSTERLARTGRFDTRRQYDMLSAEQVEQLSGKPEVARAQLFREWTTDWIADHPGRYLELAGIRLLKTLWIDWDNPKGRNIIYVGSRSLLLVLTAIGLALALGRGWRLVWPGLLVGSCLLLYMATITAARFSFPLEPLAFCFSGLALVTMFRAVTARRVNDEEGAEEQAMVAERAGD